MNDQTIQNLHLRIRRANSQRLQFCRARAIASLLACLALITSPTIGEAQVWNLTIMSENDAFPDWGDEDYTNGLRIRLDINRSLGWSPFSSYSDCNQIISNPCRRTTLMIGQNLYTPQNIKATGVQEDDRPYSAWLYAAAAAHLFEANKRMRTLELHLGTTGKPALGEEVQTWWHKLINAPEPKGWDHQVKPVGLGVIGIWEDKFAFELNRAASKKKPPQFPEVRYFPYYRITIGNVHTDAAGGVTLLFGHNLDNLAFFTTRSGIGPTINPQESMNPQMIGVPISSSESSLPKRSFFGFISVDARLVAYNALLQHCTYTPRKLKPIEHKVATLEAGIGAVLYRLHLSFRWVLRSPEFDTGRWSKYAGISFTYSHQ